MKSKLIYLILVKLTLAIHNIVYKLVARFAVKVEGGIHPKHRITNYHKFFSDNIEDGESVLDVGCGKGILTLDLATKAGKIVAIDKSKREITIAQKDYSARNIEYLLGDAVAYDFGKTFDVVVLSNVLEHVENREELLKKVKNISPKILIRVPMINRDWITLFKKENGIEWRLDNTHFTEYTLDSFKDELMKADLKLEEHSIQYGEIWGIAPHTEFRLFSLV